MHKGFGRRTGPIWVVVAIMADYCTCRIQIVAECGRLIQSQ